MLKRVIEYFKELPIKELKQDERLDFFVKLLAVATYADKKIKNVEVSETQIIIEDFLQNHFDNKEKILNLEELNLLKNYIHKRYVKRLEIYKKDSQEFIADRLYIINSPKRKEEIFQYYLQEIIKADHILTEEEKELEKEFKK
ncbi:hypothetical protein [Caminibacter pacificus]|uniref:Tellurite resistance protein TerB n=1 Tax=Caminibacter pacificus TaxID=1424653 RepID=A0AAJ4RB90_9BACT|nr:hypothetical protein [Caminibacter pacificus]QDD68135.1 hypothetical protein C6V80_09790 [Caminibacter pacificus]ROR38753.1 hypothetical protein EDC58_1968 [Caminibacter pacificus]